MKKPTTAQLRALQAAAEQDILRISVIHQTLRSATVTNYWQCSDGSFLVEKTAFACERAGWLRAEGTPAEGNYRLVLTEAGRAVLPT